MRSALLLLLLAACRGGARRTEDPGARRSQGDACFERGEFVAAVSHYEEALRQSPAHPKVLLRLGQCWESLGITSRAIPCYEQLLHAAPQSPEAPKAREQLDRLRELEKWDPNAGPPPEVILD